MLVLGVMSGTSLDGIDLALCHFSGFGPINYEILYAETIEYDREWREELLNLYKRDGLYLCSMNIHYARLIALQIQNFLSKKEVNEILKSRNTQNSDLLISSHGHTVFHEPDTGLTLQIGHGAVIMAMTRCHVICDFRSQDVALGGQGAPLVPIGDELLFGEYDACLNIGGFANVSLKIDGKRRAWDICPANIVLNRWAARLGDTMDRGGKYSETGRLIREILDQWEHLEYYQKKGPKSLGREWVESIFLENVYESVFNPRDLLHTAVEHIARRIAADLPSSGRVLVTGGGAYHPGIINRLKQLTSAEIILPDKWLIDFKEALVFGLMGYLGWHNKINVLSSVTGAEKDHCSGVIFKNQNF